jgi:nicotinate-nucleotide pyrophosphorylase
VSSRAFSCGGCTGADLISIGWLTHSTTALDIGLDHVE